MENCRLNQLRMDMLKRIRHFLVLLLAGCGYSSLEVKKHSSLRASAEHDSENTIYYSADDIYWMLLPDDNGNVQVAILSGAEPARNAPSVNDVHFVLWTRENAVTGEQEVFNSSCRPEFKYFKTNRATKLMIHGFGDAVKESTMFSLLKDAFLASGDYNVIAVDWSSLAAAPWYNSAAKNTKIVAQHTAAFIDYLIVEIGAIPDIHLVGFSLGAHVAGMTGQFVESGKLKKITGLDPARVLFNSVGDDSKLDKTDAQVVEVIHTSGHYLAFIEPIGHRDFYPNGGTWPQPGCIMDFLAVCSHRRAYYYYSEAVEKSGFSSVSCSDYFTFTSGKCADDQISTPIFMYNDLDNSVEGKFYLETNTKEPFSKG